MIGKNSLVLSCALAVLSAEPARAQFGFVIGDGPAFPSGRAMAPYDGGWHVSGGALYTVPSARTVTLTATAGYNRLFGGPTTGGPDAADLRVLEAQLGLVLRNPSGIVRPFIILAGGIFDHRLAGERAPAASPSETDWGASAGAGVEFRLRNVAIVAQGHFTEVFMEGRDIAFAPITLRLVLGGDSGRSGRWRASTDDYDHGRDRPKPMRRRRDR